MKKLKFNHKLAKLILDGQKTSIWRLFDDKDLSVNDDVELIDRVESDKPETWLPIGVAHITKIIEKSLDSITQEDMDGHELYKSSQDMIKVFREYYGSNVNSSTTVKIIYFNFMPSKKINKSSKPEVSPDLSKVTIYADGGSRGNPGPSASGYVVINKEGTVIVDKGVYLGVTTNNQAEYQALRLALQETEKLGAKEIDVYMDSLLVINQMKGIFKVKNRDLWPINEDIKNLCKKFNKVSFTHVPRELNKLADAAVNRALDEAIR